MLAQVASVALCGVDAVPITVEVSVQRGLPCFLVVGLPDTAVRESRDRVQAAFRQSELEFPAARVTVNLAPADLRKEGTWFDLPVALALLAATRQIPARRLDGVCVVGEISLDGGVRPVRGVLAAALSAAARGERGLVVPAGNAAEAAQVGGLEVIPVSHLRDAIAWARTGCAPESPPPTPGSLPKDEDPDPLRAIVGQAAAKRALEIAATGSHGILLTGPPGTGKSLLARALPHLLPELSRDEALEVTRIHSVAGLLRAGAGLLTRPPFRAPHVSASAAGVLGGGAPLRPGEVSLAHLGVLFLDELPEFSRTVLEGLRQPLEEGSITIVRARAAICLPARVQLVAAMNPCKCGWLGHPRRSCVCQAAEVARYRGRVSGPLLERLDLFVQVPVETKRVERLWRDAGPDAETTASARARILEARAFSHRSSRATANAELEGDALRAHAKLSPGAEQMLAMAATKWALSARAVHRTLRVARTIADLRGTETIPTEAVAEALSFRHEALRVDGAG